MITSLDPADSGRRGKTNILRKGFDVKADIFSNKKAPSGADVEKNDCSLFSGDQFCFLFFKFFICDYPNVLGMKFTKLNYCQDLLSSQINYTLTNLANHLAGISHDKINRYLKNEKLTPSLLWENVKELIEREENAYLIFDDTVIDKRYSEEIELTRWQYSGNEQGVIR